MDTRLYWVFGNSVEHSLSPRVHYLFAKQHGIELNYNKYHVNEVLKLFRICRWFKKNHAYTIIMRKKQFYLIKK